MDTEKIGIGVVGAGRAGMVHAENIAHRVSRARLIAVADSDEEQARRASRELNLSKYYLDYRKALAAEEIDAVIVATPTKLHKEVGVAAARAGKHILCEKPMAMNVGECEAMIQAAETNRVKLQIGFMRRFDESFLAAKRQMDRGQIGEVVLVKSLTRGPSTPQPWQYDIEASNGPLAEVNSHDIDTLRWFTGSEFQRVHAIAGNYRCPEARKAFPDFYDNVVMVCSFTNGMQGCIDGAVSVRYGYDARAEIVGTRGVIFVERMREHSSVVCNREDGMTLPFVESWRTQFADAYLEEDKQFIACILQDTEPMVSGRDGKMAVKVVSAGNRSIREGRPVALEYKYFRDDRSGGEYPE